MHISLNMKRDFQRLTPAERQRFLLPVESKGCPEFCKMCKRIHKVVEFDKNLHSYLSLRVVQGVKFEVCASRALE